MSNALSAYAMETLADTQVQPLVLSTLKNGLLSQMQASVIKDFEKSISDILASRRAAAVEAQRRAFEAERRARERAQYRVAME